VRGQGWLSYTVRENHSFTLARRDFLLSPAEQRCRSLTRVEW